MPEEKVLIIIALLVVQGGNLDWQLNRFLRPAI
jgi:hypothetical protein